MLPWCCDIAGVGRERMADDLLARLQATLGDDDARVGGVDCGELEKVREAGNVGIGSTTVTGIVTVLSVAMRLAVVSAKV